MQAVLLRDMIYKVWRRSWWTGSQETCVFLGAPLQTHSVILVKSLNLSGSCFSHLQNRLITPALPTPGLWTLVDEVGCV